MKTETLCKILELVMPAVEKKAVLPQYDHFVFYNGNVSTYNGKIFFSHPVDTDIRCSVVASDMLDVMKTVDAEEVSLEVEDGNLQITSDDVTASLSTEVYEESVVQAITSLNLDNLGEGKDVPVDFIEGLNHCKFSVSKDAQDIKNLQNIHVVEDAIESSDSYRCSEYMMASTMDEMLIPASSAEVLCRLFPLYYSVVDGWVHFWDDSDVIFSLRLGEGEYPDVGAMINRVDKDTSGVALPDTLRNVLGQFSRLSSGELDVYKSVRIDVKQDQIVLSTERDGLNMQKVVEYGHDGKEFSFLISPVFLSAIMEKTNTVAINDESNMAIFKSDYFTHVVALLVE